MKTLQLVKRCFCCTCGLWSYHIHRRFVITNAPETVSFKQRGRHDRNYIRRRFAGGQNKTSWSLVV